MQCMTCLICSHKCENSQEKLHFTSLHATSYIVPSASLLAGGTIDVVCIYKTPCVETFRHAQIWPALLWRYQHTLVYCISLCSRWWQRVVKCLLWHISMSAMTIRRNWASRLFNYKCYSKVMYHLQPIIPAGWLPRAHLEQGLWQLASAQGIVDC